MKPVLTHFFNFPIYSYGFMILLSFLSGLIILHFRFKHLKIKEEYAFDIVVISLFGGIIGGRIFHIIQYSEDFRFDILSPIGGFSWYGIFLGILFTLAYYKNINAFLSLFLATLFLIFQKYHAQTPLFFYLLYFIVLGYFVWGNREKIYALKKSKKMERIGFLLFLFFHILFAMRAVDCYLNSGNYGWKIFQIWKGGLVFYGGFICAIIFLLFFFSIKKLSILKTFDAIILVVALGLAFTRIGCFMNGCCYGRPCPKGSFWAVNFPAKSMVGDNVNLRGINRDYLCQKYSSPYTLPKNLQKKIFKPVYATQIMSSLNGFVLFLLLSFYYPYRKRDGEVLLLFGILYSIARFVIEIYRDDTEFLYATGFNIGQGVSMLLFLFSFSFFLFLKLKKHEN